MVQARLPKPGVVMSALIALVAFLVLGDAIVAVQLVAHRSLAPVSPVSTSSAAAPKGAAGTHPCNHGYYVSQAAHAKKGGKYVSGIAQSNLGKDGNCSAPLPAQAPAGQPKPSGS